MIAPLAVTRFSERKDKRVLGKPFETSSTGMLKERKKMKEKNLKEVLIDRKEKEKMNS